MTDKILLVLQFWKGDRDQAMRLARFIADLQPHRCENADFLFVSRFDCPQDKETIDYVSRKFNVLHTICRRRGIGWPGGCNELWFGAMEWCYHMIESAKIPHYKSIFTFEADNVPLTSNWISHFSHEWDRLNSYVVGALLQSPGEHINGNAMFSGDLKFLHWVAKKVGGCPPKVGWDYYLARSFRDSWGWSELAGMVSEWQTKSFPAIRFEGEIDKGTVWFHGVKDDSLLDLSRTFLLGKK